jgi:hypothetical protein
MNEAMQIRQSTFASSQFKCPFHGQNQDSDCLHRHGFYKRYANVHADTKVAIYRFLCKFTGKTLSILPDDMLPYWPLPVPELDDHFQRRSTAGDEDSEEPARTSNELPERAWVRFCSATRLQSLAQYFGQRLPLGQSPKALWQSIKRTGGTLQEILCELAQAGRSLLGDYQCLRPPKAEPEA